MARRLGDTYNEVTRKGMRLLLDRFPRAAVLAVDGQWADAVQEEGPWVIVTLDHPAILGMCAQAAYQARYAILKRTGNVYRLNDIGACEDDPFLEITPLLSTAKRELDPTREGA